MKRFLLTFMVAGSFALTGFAQENLLDNGGFDDIEGAMAARTTDAWGMWSDNGGVAEVVDGVVEVVAVAAADNWKMQVEQWDFVLENEKTYIVQFDAWADAERIIALTIEDPANGYALLGLSDDEGATDIDGEMRSKWNINVTTEMQTFILTLTVDKVVENTTAKFAFLLAQAADKVYIDNVSLVEDLSSVGSVKAEKLTVYPNPANDFITVATEIGTVINVYNVTGQLVASEVAASKNEMVDLTVLPAGIYTVKAGDKTSKVVVK